MHATVYNPKAPKKAANLSINSDLLRQAKANKINLSKTLELRLAEILMEARRNRWKTVNRDAIEAYNARIEADGVFGEGFRNF